VLALENSGMFGRTGKPGDKPHEKRPDMRPEKRPSIKAHALTSLIAEDVHILGDVYFVSGIRIDGRVTGNLIGRAVQGQPLALLVLSEKGCIEGTVSCGDAVINGTVVGDMDVDHCLQLQSQSKVSGSIRYRHLQMDMGAGVRGQLFKADDRAPEAMAAMPAEVSGPLTSAVCEAEVAAL